MKRTLLIVEDDDILASALKEQFKEADFDVEIATDGEEALSMLKKIKPDIILLDLILPKINGFEVLELIKADINLKSIPVIILSNLGQDQDIKKGMELGANDYFVKAQHPLLEIIEKVTLFLSKPQSPLTEGRAIAFPLKTEKEAVLKVVEKEVAPVTEKIKIADKLVEKSAKKLAAKPEKIVEKIDKIAAVASKEEKKAEIAQEKPMASIVKKITPPSVKSEIPEIPKSVKKFIRKQKEEIKKTVVDPEERKKKIEDLYKAYGKD